MLSNYSFKSLPSKPLTPKEFEDQYLGRTQEDSKKEEGNEVSTSHTALEEKKKEIDTSRITAKKVLKKSNDIFKLDEGFETRVRQFYDQAFDRAFEDIDFEGKYDDSNFSTTRLSAIKKLKSEDVAWGRMSGSERRVVIKHDGDKPKGVIVLHTMGDSQDIADSQQMNIYIEQEGSPPIITLRPKPLSWKMAAINLAGGISRLLFHHPGFYANMDEKARRLLHELTAAEVQIDLADHLSDGIFSAQIRLTISEMFDVSSSRFMKEMRVGEWNRALAGFAFDRMNPPVGESEELMRYWLCRIAALRYLAHKRAGKNADNSAKFQEFERLYRAYGDKFDVKYDYINT